jgi:hypothetical protein
MNDFVPGIQSGPKLAVFYQLLEGRVFMLSRNVDSTVIARGSVPLSQLEAIAGRDKLAEGWYDGTGNYLGDDVQAFT